MALVVRMTACVALALAACAAAPQASDDVTAGRATAIDTAMVGGQRLELVASGSTCAVRRGETVVSLDIPAPCQFLRRRPGTEPAVHSYNGVGAVVFVGGPPNPLTDEDRLVGIRAEDRCSVMGRALLVQGGVVTASRVLRESRSRFCPLNAGDEKVFYSAAHHDYYAPRTVLISGTPATNR